MVHILGNSPSVINNFIAELRDVEVQKDKMRFRRNLERMGEIFAYEISKHLPYVSKEVTTPLGVAKVPVLIQQPVIATILRAGLPLHRGLMNYFDQADNALVGAFRLHQDENFEVRTGYLASPLLHERTLILCDPMLASGASLVLSYNELLKKGAPVHTHVVAAIASAKGLEYVRSNISGNVTLWIGAVDEELTSQSYIVPGLGDAGDLAFGLKS